jgi:membrane-associated phospholipid phosphatase
MNPDLRLLTWIADHRGAAATRLARALMDGGNSPVVVGVTLAVVFLIGITVGQTGAMWVVVAAGGAASAIATALKSLVDRPRPPAELALVVPSGSSMPSTVAALTAGLAVALVWAPRWPRPLRRAVAVLLGLLVVLIGAAMVYLGAHWASDVLVGWVIGALIAAGLSAGWRRLSTSST